MTAAPHPAATVLVLREATAGLEVLLVRRGRGAPFMADAYVFPGGRVDDMDGPPGDEMAARRCALRELREEVHLVATDPSALVPFSHWITPAAEPRRFDTRFFLLALPAGQVPTLDERELADLIWLTPAQALARFAQGMLKLPPPTLCNLEDLAAEALVAGSGPGCMHRVLAACASRRPEPILPKLVPHADGGIAVVMPWHPSYPTLPGTGAARSRPAHVRTSCCILTPQGRWHAE
ncbi:MAG: NUDIX hydrolase [Myxococcales bacterium]|nr:NUDIX hydrolase [Myxococcota bacterium]MDW8281316.1 NUDIX hydrolase [Myxococcales bacterium]